MACLKVYRIPLAKSVILHGVMLALLLFSIQKQSSDVIPPEEPEIVQAVVLDESKIQAELDRLRMREDQKRVQEETRQQSLEQQRKQEERRLIEAQNRRKVEEKKARAEERQRQAIKSQQAQELAQLKKQQEDEAQRLETLKKKQQEIEKQRLEEEKKHKAAEEQRVAEEKRLAELERKRKQEAKRIQQAAEQRKQKKAQDAKNRAVFSKMIADARRLIQQKVEGNWIQPTSFSNGLSCRVKVKVIPGGEVVDARVIKTSGNSAFDRSAETAVLKASPLPVPNSPELFPKFRSFEFNFKPR